MRSLRERLQVGQARAVEFGDRTLGDSYTHVQACAALCGSVTTQNSGRSLAVGWASCRFDRGSRQA